MPESQWFKFREATPLMINGEERPRSKVIYFFADLNGNIKALEAYIEELKKNDIIGKKGVWKEDVTIVFAGDIVLDRYGEGFEILQRIFELREAARRVGAEVLIVPGNHERRFFELFFSRNRIEVRKRIAEEIPQFAGYLELLEKCNIPDFGHIKVFQNLKKQGAEVRSSLVFRTSIDAITELLFQNMHLIHHSLSHSKQGKKALSMLAGMPPIKRIDDMLFMHTNPTHEVIEMYLGQTSETEIEECVRSYLQQMLLQQPVSSEFSAVSAECALDTILKTSNRKNFLVNSSVSEQLIHRLNAIGITAILYGHTDPHGRQYQNDPHFIHSNMHLCPVDYGAFKRSRSDEKRSMARIGRSGEIEIFDTRTVTSQKVSAEKVKKKEK